MSKVVRLFDDQEQQMQDEPVDRMAGGFVKLYRRILDEPFAHDPVMFSAWVKVILLATHQPMKTFLGRSRKAVILQPGQFISGRYELAKLFACTENEARTIITYFERQGMIERQVSNFGTVFTVCRYSEYQSEIHQHSTSKNHQQNHQRKAKDDAACGDLSTSESTSTKPAESTTRQEYNINLEPKGSCPESAIPDPALDESVADEPVTKVRADAAVQTPNGRVWGTAEDLANARHMADTVARLQGADKSALPDIKLVRWADECRRLRGMDTNSGKSITSDHIRILWDFAHKDPFWNTNLLSPAALRKHWERLAVQYRDSKKSGGNTHAQRQSGYVRTATEAAILRGEQPKAPPGYAPAARQPAAPAGNVYDAEPVRS